MTLQDIKVQLRAGDYAWPGGYPLFYITADGGTLLPSTVRKQWREIVGAHLSDHKDGGWYVEAVDVNWEDPHLYDDHTGERIPSAYADDPEESEEA